MIGVNNQLLEINPVGLDNTNYGEHINDRFESIHHNFHEIVGSHDFLTGADGKGLDVAVCTLVQNSTISLGIKSGNEILTQGSLYDKIAVGISSVLTTEQIGLGALGNINDKSWDDSF